MKSEKLFPNEVVLETKFWKVAQDYEVAIVGFFIISSKRNIHSILDLTDTECIDLIRTMRKVRKAIHSVLKIKDVYIFQNEDSSYGFHIWMLPYHRWMKKFGSGPGILIPAWQYAKDNFKDSFYLKKVRKAIIKVRKYLMDK
ncbi:MAG TPA: hypothetical protein VJI98_01620 [Candidatus Nanoarchaeia archaeon]|nr:hypothetical protein [Candidatus Nanoarchaeia archaeon]